MCHRSMQKETQRITAHIPLHLLTQAQNITGKGITGTIKLGLESLARQQAYQHLLRLEGTLDVPCPLSEIKDMRGPL